MSHFRPSDESGNLLQSGTDEAVSRGIDRQFVETARHLTSKEQFLALRRKNIDPAPHPMEDRVLPLIAQAEAAALPLLNDMGKNLSDEIRQLVGSLLARQVVSPVHTKEIGSVEHEEPKVPNRDAAHITKTGTSRLGFRQSGRFNHHLSRSFLVASAASWGESNQYSSRSGPISVSTTCLNHSFVVPGSRGFLGVT